MALHESTLDEVLLLEGKLLFGHLGVMLNIRTQNSIAELIPHASNLDPSLVKDVVTDHTSGIHVLLAPVNVQAGQGIRAEALYNLVTALQKMYDYLIIDAGSVLNENSVTLMDLADRILLVSTPDLAALHDISRFIQLSSTLAYPPGKLAVVLNRQGMQGGVKTKDIEMALHHELFAQIPEDEANVLRSLNRGIPLVLNYPRSPASQGFRALAKSLAAVNVAAQAKQASPRAKPTSKRTQTATKPVSKATASQGTASKGTSSQRTASN